MEFHSDQHPQLELFGSGEKNKQTFFSLDLFRVEQLFLMRSEQKDDCATEALLTGLM